MRTQGAYNRIAPDEESDLKQAQIEKAQIEAARAKAGPEEKPAEYQFEKDDNGNIWRLDKLSKQAPQMVTFGPQGQPVLSAPPAGVNPPVQAGATTTTQPTFGSNKLTFAEKPVGAENTKQYSEQLKATAMRVPKGYDVAQPEILATDTNATAAEKIKRVQHFS